MLFVLLFLISSSCVLRYILFSGFFCALCAFMYLKIFSFISLWSISYRFRCPTLISSVEIENSLRFEEIFRTFKFSIFNSCNFEFSNFEIFTCVCEWRSAPPSCSNEKSQRYQLIHTHTPISTRENFKIRKLGN